MITLCPFCKMTLDIQPASRYVDCPHCQARVRLVTLGVDMYKFVIGATTAAFVFSTVLPEDRRHPLHIEQMNPTHPYRLPQLSPTLNATATSASSSIDVHTPGLS